MRVIFVQKSFLPLNSIYLFAVKKDKYQEKVFRLRPSGCVVTSENGDGVPPSHKVMAGQVEVRKRTFPLKVFFPSSITAAHWEQILSYQRKNATLISVYLFSSRLANQYRFFCNLSEQHPI